MAQEVTIESAATLSYLDTLQSSIARMADNSARCKTWCVTLVSAILVLMAKGYGYTSIALLPVVVFVFLDSYYLALERLFIKQYNVFVGLLHDEQARTKDLFILLPHQGYREISSATFRALNSFSVWPFYSVLILIIEVIRRTI